MALYLGKQAIDATSAAYATKQWVNTQGFLTEVPDGYATEEYVDGKVSDLSTNFGAQIEDKIDVGSLGTINGQSIENGNNITIDLTLYKVVAQLPTENIDPNKIYLVPDPTEPEGNVYIEYVYVNNKWEKIGEYKADVDLSNYLKIADASANFATKASLDDYVKTADLDTAVAALDYVKSDDLPVNLSDLANDVNFKPVVLLTESEYAALVASDNVDENTVYMTY